MARSIDKRPFRSDEPVSIRELVNLLGGAKEVGRGLYGEAFEEDLKEGRRMYLRIQKWMQRGKIYTAKDQRDLVLLARKLHLRAMEDHDSRKAKKLSVVDMDLVNRLNVVGNKTKVDQPLKARAAMAREENNRIRLSLSQ